MCRILTGLHQIPANRIFTTTQGLVAAGLGVALLPELALSAVHANVCVRPLAGLTLSRRIFALKRPGHESRTLRHFVEILRQVATDEGRGPARKRRAAASLLVQAGLKKS